MKNDYRQILLDAFEEAIDLHPTQRFNNWYSSSTRNVEDIIQNAKLIYDKIKKDKGYSACSLISLKKLNITSTDNYQFIRYKNEKSGKTTIQRIGKLLRDLGGQSWLRSYERDRTNFAILLQSTLTKRLRNITYKVVSGNEITKSYRNFRADIRSCMSGTNSRFTKLYSFNEDKCFLVMMSYDNVIKARALMWKVAPDKYFLDRIYCSYDFNKALMSFWKDNNGTYDIDESYDFSETISNFILEVSCIRKKTRLRHVPYMDTFSLGVCTKHPDGKIDKLWVMTSNISTGKLREFMRGIRVKYPEERFTKIRFYETDGSYSHSY